MVIRPAGTGEATTTETSTESTETTETTEVGEGEATTTTEGEETTTEGEETTTEEETASLFFNPNDIPAELKPAWNRMQGSYTKAMQASAKAQKKAEAWDELTVHPEFQKWITAMERGAGETETEETEETTTIGEKNGDKDSFRAIVREELSKALAPVRREQKEKQDETDRQEARATVTQFKKDYPQWENYQTELVDYLKKHPGAGIEDAFKIVAFDDAVALGGKDALTALGKKKKANVAKPGGPSVGTKTPPKPKSILESYQQVVKGLVGK